MIVEYKAEANERMDALEKKFDELDAPTQTETSKPPIKPNVYVSPPRLNDTARRTYDDLGFPLPRFHADPSTTSGKNQRSDFIELKDSNKPIQGKLDDMNDDHTRQHTSFGLGFEATGFGQEFGVDPQAMVDREIRHMMGTNQREEREHGGGTNQTGDRFAYHGFKHRMRNLKMPVFEGEDAYGWIYRVERWSEGRAPFPSWDGFKRRLLIRFQQSKEGNLAEVRVMNPKGLNHTMKLAISIEDNQLFECVMQSKDMKAKGLCFRYEVKYTPGHRCASRTLQAMQVDESDEVKEPDLNFKSWDRGPKID
nr:hypothetical protein [Tanacetum cinerariifolium]